MEDQPTPINRDPPVTSNMSLLDEILFLENQLEGMNNQIDSLWEGTVLPYLEDYNNRCILTDEVSRIKKHFYEMMTVDNATYQGIVLSLEYCKSLL